MHSIQVVDVEAKEVRVRQLLSPCILFLPSLQQAFLLLLNLVLIQPDLSSEGFELLYTLLKVFKVNIFVNV